MRKKNCLEKAGRLEKGDAVRLAVAAIFGQKFMEAGLHEKVIGLGIREFAEVAYTLPQYFKDGCLMMFGDDCGWDEITNKVRGGLRGTALAFMEMLLMAFCNQNANSVRRLADVIEAMSRASPIDPRAAHLIALKMMANPPSASELHAMLHKKNSGHQKADPLTAFLVAVELAGDPRPSASEIHAGFRDLRGAEVEMLPEITLHTIRRRAREMGVQLRAEKRGIKKGTKRKTVHRVN